MQQHDPPLKIDVKGVELDNILEQCHVASKPKAAPWSKTFLPRTKPVLSPGIDPQVAYSLLIHGIVPRWRFLMWSTPSDPEWFAPMEEVLAGPLSEALFGYKATGLLRERLALSCPDILGGRGR